MSAPSGPRRIAVVTGAASGIGKATARGLAAAGFDLTLVVRDAARGEAARTELQRAFPPLTIETLLIDLASQRSIREGARRFLSSHARLDVLVNVAGVFLPERSETEDGVERTFATNYLAYFLLTHELLPALRAAAPSRIVNVASRYGGTKLDFDDLMFTRRKFSTFGAVAPTMLARVLFTQELSERLQGSSVVVNAVHPGLVAHTRLLAQTSGFLRFITNTFGTTPEKGADTVVWLATAPENARVSGRLFSRRKPLPTPGQGSDPAARRTLWTRSEALTGLS